MQRLDRRSFNTLLLAGTAALATGVGVRPAAAAGKITVLNWQGYGTDEAWALEMFKARTGIEVVHDYFNSETEMLTKLRTNPGAYDVVLVNSAFSRQAGDEGLVEPIDPASIPHFAKLNPQLATHADIMADGKPRGIAWVWGITGIAYNTDTVTPAPTSVNVLWDPQFAGKVTVRDDAVENVMFAAIATGQDMNNPADMAKVKDKLLALKPQVKALWSSEDDWNKLFQAGTFSVGSYWSGSAARSKKAFKLPVGFYVPSEGGIGWFDTLSVAKGAPNAEGARAFIDFMVSNEFYVKWDTDVGAPASSNPEALAALPADAFNRTVMADPSTITRLTFMAPMPDDRRQAMVDLWQEVKTEFAL